MKPWPRYCCWALALALLVLPALRTPLSAQEPRTAFGEGTHVFRRLLQDRGFTALTKFEQLTDDPAGSILVVLGDTRALRDVPDGILRFVQRGGAVLVASDRFEQDARARQALSDLAGVAISGEKLVTMRVELFGVDLGASSRYRGRDYCPILQPVDGASPQLFGVAELGPIGGLRVATNLPSRLIINSRLPEQLEVVARLPPGLAEANAEAKRNWPAGRDFAVAGERGLGRVLVLADHSLFINEMMLPADNNNVEFADNCLAWLGDVSRSQVLLVEDGRVNPRFDVPLRSIDLPDGAANALLALFNRQIVQIGDRLMGLEDRDAFNEALVRRMPVAAYYRTLLLLATLAAFTYLAYRVGIRGRQHPEMGLPRLARAVERAAPVGPLLEQRRRAQVDAGNLREAARHLARQWFAQQGIAAPAAGKNADPPRVQGGGWWQRWKLQRRVQRLWALAGWARRTVRPAECRRLRDQLAELSGWIAGGKICLLTDGDSTGRA